MVGHEQTDSVGIELTDDLRKVQQSTPKPSEAEHDNLANAPKTDIRHKPRKSRA